MTKEIAREDEALDKFLKDKEAERQLELAALRMKDKVVSKGDAGKAVQDMLRDKLPAKESSFEPKGQKSSGISAGYVATEKETGNTFLLKHFYKSKRDIPEGTKHSRDDDDRDMAVRELLGSTIYQLLLYGRTPKEGLVIPDQQDPKHLYVRSKFFTNAITLAELVSDIMEKRTPMPPRLESFEKVMAACDLLGEIDYHGGNLMVQDGAITKIDHGRSFLSEFTSFISMVKKKHEMFHNYAVLIEVDLISFSIEKYNQALNQMLKQYNQEQIEAIIDKRFDELEKAGFDPRGSVVTKINGEKYEIGSFQDLRQFYKDRLRESVVCMKDVAKCTEVISKFSDQTDEFRNGGWVKAFAEGPSYMGEPVLYAVHNNIKIEGQNALEWAFNNNYKISGKDPIDYIISRQEFYSKELVESTKEFLAQAIVVGLIDGTKYYEADFITKKDVEKVRSKHEDTGSMLDNLVDGFTKEMALGGAATEEKVTQFYDKLLSNLEGLGYLTKQDIAQIKQNKDYSEHVEKVVKLINTDTSKSDLTVTDKMYYMVARFAKAIGFSSVADFPVADYCMSQVPKAKLGAFSSIEEALSHGVKIAISHKSKSILQAKGLEAVNTHFQDKRYQRNLKFER